MNLESLKNAYRLLMRPVHIIKYSKQAIHIAKMPTYHPEQCRSKYLQRAFDNLSWLCRYGYVNEFYTLYGMDISGNSGGVLR